MRSREEIFHSLRQHLEEMFEVPPDAIRLDAQLYEDLDLDSLDAVDLIVRLQDLTKTRIKPEQFKAVRTVADVLDAVERTLRG